MPDRLKIFFRDKAIAIFEKYLSGNSIFTKANTLLIIRTDGIGDYVLFRNFIKSIKESERFKNYKITLFGNVLWKELAETYDKEYIDKFIWIDKKKFWSKSGWVYRYSVLFNLHSYGYEILIQPNDTRKNLTEYILKHSGVKKTVVKDSDKLFFHNESSTGKSNLKNFNNNNSENAIFQFYRNKNFIEDISGNRITFTKPYFKIAENKISEDYIVIFPGAGNESRMWSAEHFADICNKVWEEINIKIIICGSESDKIQAGKIIEKANCRIIEDKTGKTNLPELVRIISNAKLLISNETGAVHIGAAVNTKTICISNGNHFGRFHPYPKEVSDLITTVYPREIINELENFETLVRRFYIKSDLDINKIKPEIVFEHVLAMIDSGKEKVHNEISH